MSAMNYMKINKIKQTLSIPTANAMVWCYFEEDDDEEEMFIGLVIFLENISKNVSVSKKNNFTITRILTLLGNRRVWQ